MDSEEMSLHDVHLSGIADAARALRGAGLGVLAGQVELAREHFAALAQPSDPANAAWSAVLPFVLSHVPADQHGAMMDALYEALPGRPVAVAAAEIYLQYTHEQHGPKHGIRMLNGAREEDFAAGTKFYTHPTPQESDVRLARAIAFIDSLGAALHSRRTADWHPEGAHNAASQMSEDMRLLGNDCADFDSAIAQQPKGAGQS